ncbi:PKHD-type hydroxylase Smlt1146 [Sphingomonas antarctica]|uniref:Fe2+-dependent dioxygenase n=1 Tax=Sphingomonas antarctica TaxID=2040274 RepID=UPI0039E9B896
MIIIPDVLNPAEVAHVRSIIDAGDWIDGNATSGHQSALAKRNRQLDEGSAAAREAGNLILDALGRAEVFVAAALPLKVYPPLFNRYASGETFGSHVDSAIRIRAGSDFRIRSDLSATLFLSDDYDGGELTIEGQSGAQSLKLPSGHMLLYPSSSLHRVEPVTRGERVASFFWIQSMVRDDAARRILFDLDNATRAVAAAQGQDARAAIELTGVYHNLLRRWADA